MRPTKFRTTLMLALLALASSISLALALSIEREPVKVTHRNSGPKYDIDEDKLTPTNPESQQPTTEATNSNNNNNQKDKDDNDNRPPPTSGVVRLMLANNNGPAGEQQDPQQAMPIGRIAIRRIFLVPMMSPSQDWSAPGGDQQEPPAAAGNSDVAQEQPSPFLPRPLWPFSLMPARHQHPHHMLGQDEASRPPVDAKEREESNDNSPSASGEREAHPEAPMLIDPIKMMIDMMQQAIAGQLAPPPAQQPGDLNPNEASVKPTTAEGGVSRKPPTVGGQLDQPIKPTNETKEDIVDIDGKKYLRRTIINRHVGENIIFMTKRLIFTPLNETDSNDSTTTTTTVRPADGSTEIPIRPTGTSPTEQEATSTTTTTTTTSTTPASAPTTTTTTPETITRTDGPAESSSPADRAETSASPSTTTTTTTEQPKESTTAKVVSETVNKAAERLTDSTITTN